MENRFEMVAKTFQGLEDVLSDELIALGAENVEIGNRMVSFEGDNETLYKANLCCRTALRVLKPIVKFKAKNTDELYDFVRDLNWEQFMNTETTFAIDSTVSGEDFTHSKFVTYRVKDAIADHFYDTCGQRPSIRLQGADLMFNVHISGDQVTISLDSSGEPLYKRGYRAGQTEAPINEVLAAGIILKTGWRGDCDFVDPMCGSGTFLIEAALIAANINPGIYRENFAFEKWQDFDSELFEELYNDDSGEREITCKIMGGDIDPEAVKIARKNIKSAKVEDMVEVTCKPFSEWTDNAPEGVLVTNPPYGERLRPENIVSLYKGIGTTLKNYFQGWHAWLIGYKDEQLAEIGLKPSVKIALLNGKLECSLREYVLFDGKYSEFRAEGGSVANKDARTAGPKKVKHISDDDWAKETKKFNAGKGFKDDRKKSKPFTRDGRKDSFRESNDRDMQDSRGSKYGGNNFSRDNFERSRNNSGRDKFNRDNYGRDRFNRDNFGRDRFNRDNSGRDRFSRERDNFTRDRERGGKPGGFGKPRQYQEGRGGINYNPANSKGPSISKEREQIINPVHYRQRKKKEDSESED